LAAALLLAGCGEPKVNAPESAAPTATTTAVAAPTLAIVTSGAEISGANGMHIGPDGMLYVASVLGSELIVIDPDTGQVQRRIGAADGVAGPDDVAFAPDGAFYWTSILTGEVAGFRPDGSRVVAAKLGEGVNPLTFSDDGRLFVAQCFFGDKLYEVDPLGKAPARPIREDLGPRCGLNGMDWGPDDRLYGPRWFRGEVVGIDVDTGDMKTVASGFGVPAAVKFDGAGKLNVLDTLAGKVIRVDGDQQTVVAELMPGLDNFAFDAAGRLFVSSFTDGSVTRIDPDGTHKELSPGGMSSPGGVAVIVRDNKPEVIVADLHAVRGIDPTTGASTFVARNILGVSELGSSLSAAADGDQVILTSWLDNDVRVWDPATQKVVEQYRELGEPVDALRYMGQIVVSEHAKHRVITIDGDNITVLAEGLEAPTGLAVRGDELLVADRVRGQVLSIAKAGAAVTPPALVVGELDGPEGIAVVEDGLVVMEAGRGRVTLLGSNGTKQTLGELTPGQTAGSDAQPPSMIFNGVAAGPDGTVYVTAEKRRGLFKITW
jgi:sugar lactone lactonase YvrE